MTKQIRQTSFSAGQADQVTWKRTDVEQYLTAAQSLLNCEVGTTGLARKRKGTVYNQNVSALAELNSTMYELVDKNGQAYLVLAASGMFYVFSAPGIPTNVIDYNDELVHDYLGNQVIINVEDMAFIQAVTVPYDGDDLFYLDYTQDNDSLIISSANWPPARIYVSNYSPLTFSFEYLQIYPLPAYDFSQINYNNTTVTLSTTVSGGLGVLTIKFAGLPAGSVYNNAWIGGQIIGGGTSVTQPVGYAIITAVSQSSPGADVTFTATVQLAFQTTNYATTGAQYSIRQPTWVSATGNPYGLGYPEKVLYFQNRLWFGNTQLLPTTVFGSKLNQPISFDVGVSNPTDAIIYTIGVNNSGAIQWMNGGKQMEIYCTNLEFACPQNEDVGLTPSTFSIRQQSAYGSSSLLKPQTYLNDSYFAQKTGKAVINYQFQGVGLAYKSTNVAPQSQSLVKNPNNRALLRGTDVSQDNFIYFINDSDNTITAFQFASEANLAALTPIEFEDNVNLVDIVTVGNVVYILKYYSLTQQFIIESFQTNVFIDSAEEYVMNISGFIYGLQRFDGYTVQVIYQNQDYGQYLVENGEIQVFNPEQLTGIVTVGLLYDVEIIPMYPYFSSTSSPLKKKIFRVYIDYYQSLNFFINGTLVQYQNFHDIQLGLPLIPRTDTAIYDPVEGYDRFDGDSIVITQSSPFDLQILGIAYQIDMFVL